MTFDDVAVRSRARWKSCGKDGPAEIVVCEESSHEPLDAGRLEAFAAAGATWFMDGLSTRALTLPEDVFERVKVGPPTLSPAK